ncbi:MAG: ATP synthase delta/epsilon chain alpha-helix domain-containing protein, partial [Oscillospiraceae bacterium]|nr:ATP synthase delta/epsilon chain alpha-helix domain-containing protein [Oscillospiraceae bacterium]
GIGVANVVHNEVTLLVRAAEPAEEIDLPRAEASGQRARERLAQKAADLDAARAEASLRRALARQKAAHLASEQ